MKVICTIPTATSPINGHEFQSHERGLVGDVPDDLAAALITIPGYELADPPPPAEDDLEALRAHARGLGVDVKLTWREARLKAEIERAEEAAS